MAASLVTEQAQDGTQHNSLLSFGTPTASSRIVFDALRKDLDEESDDKDIDNENRNAGPSSPPSSSSSRDSPVVGKTQLSPQRKAILARFTSINKGPPSLISSRQELHATHTSALGDASMSLNLNASRRGGGLGNTSTSMDYDIMGAPDDSLLIKAKQMGEESFDRRLLADSPGKREALRRKVQARQSVAPKRQGVTTSSERNRSSPARMGMGAGASYPKKGNALGLGLGIPASSPDKSRTRSFSTVSDTSNLFDEQGEQSLLYATMRGKPGPSEGEKGKLLAALQGDDKGTVKKPASTSSPVRSSKPTKLATALGAAGSSSSSSSSSSPARRGINGRILPSTPASAQATPRARTSGIARPSAASASATPRAGTTPSNGSNAVSSSSAARISRPSVGVAATPRSARPPVSAVAATPRSRTIPSTSATPRATPSSASASASATPRATPSSGTPRSRPPLNASAARLRRLSGLPQLMDDEGKMKPPAGSAVKSSASSSVAAGRTSIATGPRSSAIPQRPRSSILTTGRPSLAGRKALSSPRATHIARPAPGSAVKSTSSKAGGLPASPSAAAGKMAKARPISMYAGPAPTQLKSAPSSTTSSQPQLTGQLPTRRPPPTSMSRSPQMENSNLPSLSTSRKPPRPFLLGWGTNHSVWGDSPPLQGDVPLPAEGQGEGRTFPRKSIATSTVPAQSAGGVASVGGLLPKSTSMSHLPASSSSSSASTSLPMSRLAQPSTAMARLPPKAGSPPSSSSSPPTSAGAVGAVGPRRPGSAGSSGGAGGMGTGMRSSSAGGGGGGFWKYNKSPVLVEERELAAE
ncbi:hypothetical protein BDZ90DRAFT_45163 [Jaminaea rosea]|uniref:Uncharacterized protein n=1 Tax=Jaminaea rosea TaxID=1569628 RepID=A0A316URZ1_9BASI|nr:hypothetical protein BDZ90DRAFT_45163 [Jaminaea rosea]PWN26643.1 hypothetical protein BDZ90DRAFT_45163 [Jaminaea rosea]